MEIFNYHPITGEFLSVGIADENPLEPENPIVSGYATPTAPPAVEAGRVRVYRRPDGTAPQNWPEGAWTVVPDYRAVQLYRTVDGSAFELGGEYSGLGDLPSFLTDEPRPSPAHKWVADEWVLDDGLVAELLEAVRAEKNAEINAARLAANRSTFVHAGKAFACDELSRSDIDGVNGYATLFGALPADWPGAWKAVDNSYVPIATLDDWKAFYASMVAAGNANFAHAQALKVQLAAATTIEQVQAISWE
ncbi:DUF4376 domain-containing protein [Cupriavidus sp. a3]|uniref:DUF4376 domain-containing protein n=1 Tax=Cupriavidus sp. a3 TaxID=3242158 RepID=UPI003D9C64E1